jgi:hypothetical protein
MATDSIDHYDLVVEMIMTIMMMLMMVMIMVVVVWRL